MLKLGAGALAALMGYAMACGLFPDADPFAGAGVGSPLDCVSIEDNDDRHLCLAHATGKKLECELIHDRTKRYTCRATVR
jgi:hypothetical protein